MGTYILSGWVLRPPPEPGGVGHCVCRVGIDLLCFFIVTPTPEEPPKGGGTTTDRTRVGFSGRRGGSMFAEAGAGAFVARQSPFLT